MSDKESSEERGRRMVEELCDLDEGLSGWEIDFIDDMADREGEYTEGQLNKIEQIWNKRIGNK